MLRRKDVRLVLACASASRDKQRTDEAGDKLSKVVHTDSLAVKAETIPSKRSPQHRLPYGKMCTHANVGVRGVTEVSQNGELIFLY
jgi:hypothetical protein